MRTVLPRSCPARIAPALAIAGAFSLATAVLGPSAGAQTPPATAQPGLGSPHACAPVVTYSLGGPTPAPRPLPTPASSVGGDRLAAPGLQVTPTANVPPPAPRATAWLVADLGSGQVLASCNAHVPLAPASALKVLTALALSPRLPDDAQYTARHEDAAVDGTKVGLVPGSVYTAGDLWHALLMSSANDAATGLAEMAGGTEAAIAAMNQTARSLGALDTTARNTSGLDEPGQVSSAYDLTLFGRAALADPTITQYFRTRSYPFPGPGAAIGAPGRTTFQIQNHDRLLYNYSGALGIKNGWTSTTGGSFIGAAERGGRRIAATVLAADPQTWRMSAALLDWAFTATSAGAPGVGRLVDPSSDQLPAGPAGPGVRGVAADEVARASAQTGGLDAGELFALAIGSAALLAAAAVAGRSRLGPRAGGRPAGGSSTGGGPAGGSGAGDSGTVTIPDPAWRRRRSW